MAITSFLWDILDFCPRIAGFFVDFNLLIILAIFLFIGCAIFGPKPNTSTHQATSTQKHLYTSSKQLINRKNSKLNHTRYLFIVLAVFALLFCWQYNTTYFLLEKTTLPQTNNLPIQLISEDQPHSLPSATLIESNTNLVQLLETTGYTHWAKNKSLSNYLSSVDSTMQIYLDTENDLILCSIDSGYGEYTTIYEKNRRPSFSIEELECQGKLSFGLIEEIKRIPSSSVSSIQYFIEVRPVEKQYLLFYKENGKERLSFVHSVTFDVITKLGYGFDLTEFRSPTYYWIAEDTIRPIVYFRLNNELFRSKL